MESVSDPHRRLEPLGLTSGEEAVYRLLLRRGSLPLADVARDEGLSRREALEVMSSLESKGLISRSAGGRPRYIPADPDAAMEVLLLRRREELERTRLAIQDLVEESRNRAQARAAGHLVEVINGREAIFRRFNQLQRTARDEILLFDTPPYASGGGQNTVELELLGKGIRYRTLYAAGAMEQPGQPEILNEIAGAGEEARILPELPMRLAIADHKAALIPLRLSGSDTEEGDILIHPSPLLEALVTLFEALWSQALPVRFRAGAVSVEDGGELTEEAQRLLTMLAADLKDDVIARQMGMGRRSVQRRTQRLMQRAGAHSRLQLVVLAIRRGWI